MPFILFFFFLFLCVKSLFNTPTHHHQQSNHLRGDPDVSESTPVHQLPHIHLLVQRPGDISMKLRGGISMN